MKILLGVTGSVASTLTLKFVKMLLEEGHDVKMVYTEKAEYFFLPDRAALHVLSQTNLHFRLFHEYEEWCNDGVILDQYVKDQKVLHVELAIWADVIVIAPATANTIAKIVNGIADNLLTSVVLARPQSVPLVVAPAMNTNMWYSKPTMHNIVALEEMFVTVVEPQRKKLACGADGIGALANLDIIIQEIYDAQQERLDKGW